WDTSWLLSEKSIIGRMMHTLIGYSERPTEMQLVVYIATLVVMFVLMRIARPTPRPRVPVAAEQLSAACRRAWRRRYPAPDRSALAARGLGLAGDACPAPSCARSRSAPRCFRQRRPG